MLAGKVVMATVAVRDLTRARPFYEDVLGLKLVADQDSEALTFESADSRILVYRSEYAGTNKATAATWIVGQDIDKVVQSLREKGARFEHYDMPGTTRKGDVHVAGDLRVAWLKDPDGNIHALVSG